MGERLDAGMASAAGSFIGLIVGSVVGQALSKRTLSSERSTATVVIAGMAGMTLGAFTGGFMAGGSSAPAPGVAGLPKGLAGSPVGLGAGHKCTAKSATAIAQQLPGAPWVYDHSAPPGSAVTVQTATGHYDVKTEMGAKKIPARFFNGNHGLLLECPYTHELFYFRRGASRLAA